MVKSSSSFKNNIHYIHCEPSIKSETGQYSQLSHGVTEKIFGVPDCFNGKIEIFHEKSGPFPDQFLNFSGRSAVVNLSMVCGTIIDAVRAPSCYPCQSVGQ